MTIKMARSAGPVEDQRADTFIAGRPKQHLSKMNGRQVVVNLRFDARLLARIDAAARRQAGMVERSAASKALEA